MFGSRTTTRSQFETVATKTYMWRSTDQNFFYYDKDAGERVALPEGAKLIPLTTTNAVTGSRERDHGKATARWNLIMSNEFTDFKADKVVVREYDKLDNTRNVVFEGVYTPTIKEAIDGLSWAKYTKYVYCLLDGEVVKLSLSGASISAWIEFENQCKKDKVYLVDSHYISLGDPEHKKTGTVDYFAPTFVLGDITPEENAKANEIAADVEAKLAHNRQVSGTTEAPVEVYTAPQAETTKSAADEVPDDVPTEINLDEVPF